MAELQMRLFTDDELFRIVPCPRCKLYHSTSKEALPKIRKQGLKGYGFVGIRGANAHFARAIRKADLYIESNGCSHDGAIFFYNDPRMMPRGRPYVEVDIRDLQDCSIESSEQLPWEILVGDIADGERSEDELDNRASEYCDTFDRYIRGEIYFDGEKINEETIPGPSRERQVMVFCDIPPDKIKVVE